MHPKKQPKDEFWRHAISLPPGILFLGNLDGSLSVVPMLAPCPAQNSAAWFPLQQLEFGYPTRQYFWWDTRVVWFSKYCTGQWFASSTLLKCHPCNPPRLQFKFPSFLKPTKCIIYWNAPLKGLPSEWFSFQESWSMTLVRLLGVSRHGHIYIYIYILIYIFFLLNMNLLEHTTT